MTPSRRAPGPLRIAALLVVARLRSFRNGLRLRGRVRTPLLLVTAAVVTSIAYVGLFAQSFAVVVATVGPAGQAAALSVVTGLLAFASWTAKAASSEAVRAGSPENEFLLARPIGLGALVAGRSIADALTDPMGALFLLPVLLAAALVWRLPPAAWVAAAGISALVQLGIALAAYAAQVLLVRLVPPSRRRGSWVAMRLLSALSLAALWMVGTAVLRDPAALGRRLAAAPGWLAFTPGALIAGPLAAWTTAGLGGVALALARLALAVAGVGAVALIVAARAGLSGWEEAGAVWADVGPAPRRAGAITAANKDLRLIARDRTQLMVLVAMPAIFVGVQIFGAAGWTWSTGSLARVSCLSYSLALYMATIGPLTHMQAERRAFWILRTVPVPLGDLLAAKARAWAAIVGGTAAVTFAALSVLMPAAPLAAVVTAGLLVTGGAAAMSFLAVAMASGGADLSDEQSPAVGPTTIYAFLLVGGLYNLVLTGGPATRAAGLLLYVFTIAAYWSDGIARAEICYDAEAIRASRLRLADGATLVLIAALAGRGLTAAAAGARGPLLAAVLGLGLALRVLLAFVGLWLLRRARPEQRRRRVTALRVGLAGLAGIGVGWASVWLGRPVSPLPAALAIPPAAWVGAIVGVTADEIVWRGVLQGLVEQWLERVLSRFGAGVTGSRIAAAAVTGALSVAALSLAGSATGAAVAAVLVACAGRAATGRLAGGMAARLGVTLTRLVAGTLP